MIDDTDKKILTLLQRDGRLTNAEIAEAVGLSVSAAHRRVKQLEASGIIKGYGAKVERSAAGLSLLAYVFVKLESHAEEHLAAFEEERLGHVGGKALLLAVPEELHAVAVDVRDLAD